MGSKSTKEDKSFSINIILDQKLVMAGEKVSGTIECQFKEHYPAGILSLKLIGKEKVMWTGTDSMNSESKYPGKIVMRKPLIEQNQIIHTFDPNEELEGIKRFQFQFDLPPNLPQSFFYLGKQFADIRITYKLKAQLEPAKLKTQSGKGVKPLRDKRIFVYGQYPQKIQFDLAMQHVQPVKQLSLKTSDEIKATFTLDKDAYQPNECLVIKGNLESKELRSDQWKLTFSLIRFITSVSAKGIEYKDESVCLKRVVKGFSGNQGDLFHEIQFPLNPVQIDEKYMQNFRWIKGHVLDELKDWYNAFQPSIKTNLFESKYFVEIKFESMNETIKKKIAPFMIPVSIYYSSQDPPSSPELFEAQSRVFHEKLHLFNEQRKTTIMLNPFKKVDLIPEGIKCDDHVTHHGQQSAQNDMQDPQHIQ